MTGQLSKFVLAAKKIKQARSKVANCRDDITDIGGAAVSFVQVKIGNLWSYSGVKLVSQS